ncbi:MAG: glycosyltransferase family 2 protein [Lachnospiraceae bacterium]|nr:glycosyltransferase family 2 protein [Lachnospiraceae bacterium]
MKITVVIPNYNGIEYLKKCMLSLEPEWPEPASVLLVDNGSTDGSVEWFRQNYPLCRCLELGSNTGFSGAVNAGIKASESEYVILLNNDTEVKTGFIAELLEIMDRKGNEKVFSASSMMIDMWKPELIDDAGDLYCALGWAFSRGKGKSCEKYETEKNIFAACGGASIYRRSVFEEIGYFDEQHFMYLEDIDIGYRALIHGYRNVYQPKAKVLHAGSASSGSRYNDRKTVWAAANSVYLIWKNMPLLQWIFNLPLLLLGFMVKWLFFAKKKMGKLYLQGLKEGFAKCKSKEGKAHKVPFKWANFGNYVSIQIQLWINIFRRLGE